MTPDQLADIAARNAARTQGKWVTDPIKPGIVRFNDDPTTGFLIGQRDNAAFIAHASDDIPSLLAEVKRLTAALAEAESINSEFSWEYAAQIAERFGVNESDRRKFGNEMAEVFRAMVRP